MGRVYYNEWDQYVAGWLRQLIEAGHLPAGDVDERSIEDVTASDLAGYSQCHFFAGIGGWPLALEMAGWGGRDVWTGSCPCQPFSLAGEMLAERDDRHVWPAFRRLISECRPPTVFGEQVASPPGRRWLSGVRADLEHMGYVVGAADLCAAGVGAPHVRQRLWWVADSNREDVAGLIDKSHPPTTIPKQELSLDGGGLLPPWVGLQTDSVPFDPAHGFSRPLVEVRAYGNAIVPQVGAEFVRSFMEIGR